MAKPLSELFVHTFARGLQAIEVIGQSAQRTTIAKIAQFCAFPPPVVRRVCCCLWRN